MKYDYEFSRILIIYMLGPRTANMVLSIYLKMKMIKKVLKQMNPC